VLRRSPHAPPPDDPAPMFDSNPGNTFGTQVAELAGFGLAYLHVVEEDGAPESGPRFDIGGFRNLWNGPYIVNGNYDYSRAMKAIADGRADFVSFGKLFLANPDLPLGFARSAPLNVPDRGAFYGADDRGYIDHPFLEEPTLRCGNLFWQPVGARNTLPSLAIVQRRRPAVSRATPPNLVLDMRPDRESLQGGAVSQERSWLFHWAKTKLSLVLGLLMLTFGFLKFVSPTIDGWFHVQIQHKATCHTRRF
jgi:NADH:flavin oxidoreductase / NADH oxidase family